MLLGNELLSVF